MAVESSSSTWSQRFEEGLHPAIERFNASIGFDITLLQQDLDGSIAHARMLASTGLMRDGGTPAYTFLTTGAPGEFERIGRRFLGPEMIAASQFAGGLA